MRSLETETTPLTPETNEPQPSPEPQPLAPAAVRAKLDELLKRSSVSAHFSPVGKLTRVMGIVGDEVTRIEELTKEYDSKSDHRSPTRSLELMAQSMFALDPIRELSIDPSMLSSSERRQYTFALQKLTEARQLKARVMADHPEISGELTKAALMELTSSYDGGEPLIVVEPKRSSARYDAVANVLYAGNAADLVRAKAELNAWLGQNLNHVSNPKVIEFVDQLNRRLAYEQRMQNGEQVERKLAA